MVELHGAEIALESRVGEGTTVTVCFPESRAYPPADADGHSVASE
tara:strand:+ start:1441 stop:1575 length:135 start_codon:yes stop_codon:yes gene_type:complete